MDTSVSEIADGIADSVQLMGKYIELSKGCIEQIAIETTDPKVVELVIKFIEDSQNLIKNDRAGKFN